MGTQSPCGLRPAFGRIIDTPITKPSTLVTGHAIGAGGPQARVGPARPHTTINAWRDDVSAPHKQSGSRLNC